LKLRKLLEEQSQQLYTTQKGRYHAGCEKDAGGCRKSRIIFLRKPGHITRNVSCLRYREKVITPGQNGATYGGNALRMGRNERCVLLYQQQESSGKTCLL
jgi:hypothetical protein